MIENIGLGSWKLELFIVVLSTLFLIWLKTRLFNKLISKTTATESWNNALLISARHPSSLLIATGGLNLAIKAISTKKLAAVFSLITPLSQIMLIVSVVWFLTGFIRRMEAHFINQKIKQEEKFDLMTINALARLLRLSIYISGFLIILQTSGYSISGVLAFGGIGGIAIGFASRDMLANFFGCMMLYLDRPFSVGDWIRSPDKKIEGIVEEIGWRLTRIRTFDKRPLYVPNSVFSSIAVENPSRMSHRRIKETIGIRYDDANKMHAITAAVKQMLIEHHDIDEKQTLIVNFDRFAPSSIDFFIYTFTHTTEWILYHKIKQDVFLKIIEIIEAHGAECAFPTSTIHIANEDIPQ